MTFDLKPEESDAIIYPYLKNKEKNTYASSIGLTGSD